MAQWSGARPVRRRRSVRFRLGSPVSLTVVVETRTLPCDFAQDWQLTKSSRGSHVQLSIIIIIDIFSGVDSGVVVSSMRLPPP